MLASYTDEVLLISILVRLGITSLILCSSLHCSQLKENLAIWFTRDLWNHRSCTILYPGEPSMGYCWRARYKAQRTSGSLRCVYICRIKLSAFSVGCWTPQTSARVKRVLHLKILSQLFVAHLPVSEHDLYCAHS